MIIFISIWTSVSKFNINWNHAKIIDLTVGYGEPWPPTFPPENKPSAYEIRFFIHRSRLLALGMEGILKSTYRNGCNPWDVEDRFARIRHRLEDLHHLLHPLQRTLSSASPEKRIGDASVLRPGTHDMEPFLYRSNFFVSIYLFWEIFMDPSKFLINISHPLI